MHSARSVKAYYFAAFVLGALIALLVAAPARAEHTSEQLVRPSGFQAT